VKTQDTEFARIVGRVPNLKPPQIYSHAFLGEVTEAFGPPEKLKRASKSVLYWNFQSETGATGFSIRIELTPSTRTNQELDIELATRSRKDSRPFVDWAMYRIGTVSQRDVAPVFLNGEKFVIVPA
jgi:hypothetical protein